MGIGIYTIFFLEVSATMLSSNRPAELGLERGRGGAQIGAPGLDEIENGGNSGSA